MPSSPATNISNWFTVSFILDRTRTQNASVKTKTPTTVRMALSRNSVVAMMRGVYCPPATWIATSSEPKVKTRNDRFIVMRVSSVDRAPVSDSPWNEVASSVQPRVTIQASMACTTR